MSDPGKALLAALRSRCRPYARLHATRSDSHPWRSLLFDGERHLLDVTIDGPDVDQAVHTLREATIMADLDLPGHLLVELSMEKVDPAADPALFRLRALTLDAGTALSA
jgi:hypothetical protein